MTGRPNWTDGKIQTYDFLSQHVQITNICFGGKATKKDVFEKIAEAFTKESGRRVTGEQCLRKWGK